MSPVGIPLVGGGRAGLVAAIAGSRGADSPRRAFQSSGNGILGRARRLGARLDRPTGPSEKQGSTSGLTAVRVFATFPSAVTARRKTVGGKGLAPEVSDLKDERLRKPVNQPSREKEFATNVTYTDYRAHPRVRAVHERDRGGKRVGGNGIT